MFNASPSFAIFYDLNPLFFGCRIPQFYNQLNCSFAIVKPHMPLYETSTPLGKIHSVMLFGTILAFFYEVKDVCFHIDITTT